MNYHSNNSGSSSNTQFNNLSRIDQSIIVDDDDGDVEKLSEDIKKLTAELQISNNMNHHDDDEDDDGLQIQTKASIDQRPAKALLNYGLTFKKRKPLYRQDTYNLDVDNNLNDSLNNIQQYDDLTDVRVMAKMQEDS